MYQGPLYDRQRVYGSSHCAVTTEGSRSNWIVLLRPFDASALKLAIHSRQEATIPQHQRESLRISKKPSLDREEEQTDEEPVNACRCYV